MARYAAPPRDAQPPVPVPVPVPVHRPLRYRQYEPSSSPIRMPSRTAGGRPTRSPLDRRQHTLHAACIIRQCHAHCGAPRATSRCTPPLVSMLDTHTHTHTHACTRTRACGQQTAEARVCALQPTHDRLMTGEDQLPASACSLSAGSRPAAPVALAHPPPSDGTLMARVGCKAPPPMGRAQRSWRMPTHMPPRHASSSPRGTDGPVPAPFRRPLISMPPRSKAARRHHAARARCRHSLSFEAVGLRCAAQPCGPVLSV